MYYIRKPNLSLNSDTHREVMPCCTYWAADDPSRCAGCRQWSQQRFNRLDAQTPWGRNGRHKGLSKSGVHWGLSHSIQWLRTKNCAAVPINIAIYGIFSASITNSSAKLPKILNGHMQRLYDALCLICLIHQNVVNSLNSPYFWTTWAIQPMWWSHLKASRPLALVEPTAAATSGVLPGGWVDVTFFQLAVGWCDFCPTDAT